MAGAAQVEQIAAELAQLNASAGAPASPPHRAINLQAYAQAQQRIAELESLQIRSQVLQLQRDMARLQQQLAAAAQQQEQQQQAANWEGQLQEAASRMAVWQAKEAELAAAQRVVRELEQHIFASPDPDNRTGGSTGAGASGSASLTVTAVTTGVAATSGGAAAGGAAAAQGPCTPRRQCRIELLDALCAVEEGEEGGELGSEEEEETEEGQEQEQEGGQQLAQEQEQERGGGAAAQQSPPGSEGGSAEGLEGETVGDEGRAGQHGAADEFGRFGRGRILRIVASKLRRRGGKVGHAQEEAQAGDHAQEKHGQYRYGRGRLLSVAADKLQAAVEGRPLEVEVVVEEQEGEGEGEEEQEEAAEAAAGGPKDKYGRIGRGRLLRIAADKLRRAREARKRRRQAGVDKVGSALRAHGKAHPADKSLFHEAANSFNPALDCPPSTFLWPYRSGFLGKLHKLQTGPVLQAFYRFGPFDTDPDRPNRLIPAARRPDRPPLMLLSRLGSTMIAWGVPLLRALACSHEVIIFDYRGAGLSKDSSEEPWNYYNQAEAVLLLADALGISRPNFFGWSSGGNVGLVLAALHGQRIGRVASLAGVAGGKNTVVPPAVELLNPELSLTIGQSMSLLFPPEDPDFRPVCAQYIKAVFSMPGSITNQHVGDKAAQEQWEADKQFLAADERVWEALPQIATPVLLLNGERDALVPPENARRLAARIPGAQLHLFPDWGHGFKEPHQLAEVLNGFLLADS